MAGWALVFAMLSDPAGPEAYARIELGMTRAQVQALLGRPPARNVSEAERFSWWYTTLSDDVRRNGELWRFGSVRLWVRFDGRGRVRGKMLEGASPPAKAKPVATP